MPFIVAESYVIPTEFWFCLCEFNGVRGKGGGNWMIFANTCYTLNFSYKKFIAFKCNKYLNFLLYKHFLIVYIKFIYQFLRSLSFSTHFYITSKYYYKKKYII